MINASQQEASSTQPMEETNPGLFERLKNRLSRQERAADQMVEGGFLRKMLPNLKEDYQNGLDLEAERRDQQEKPIEELTIDQTRDYLAWRMSHVRSPSFFRGFRRLYHLKKFHHAKQRHLEKTEHELSDMFEDTELSQSQKREQIVARIVTDKSQTEAVMFEKYVKTEKKYGKVVKWIKERSGIVKGALTAAATFAFAPVGLAGTIYLDNQISSRHLATNRERVERQTANQASNLNEVFDNHGGGAISSIAAASALKIVEKNYENSVNADRAEIQNNTLPLHIGALAAFGTMFISGAENSVLG